MKKLFLALLSVCCVAQYSCNNPLKGIQLYVRNDYYKYTVTMSIVDADHPGTKMDNASVTVSGPDGTAIYDRDGKQSFSVQGGLVDFSVIPTTAPTAQSPLTFVVNISLANYIPVTKIVTITPDQTVQRFTVRMLNGKSGSSGGLDISNRTIVLSSGGISKPGYSGARTTGYSDSTADAMKDSLLLYMPGGLSFYYYVNSAGKACGTQATILTHDSTVTVGANTALYRPIANYYDVEAAYYPSTTYTKTTYTGSNLDVYFVYEPAKSSGYSIYNYGSPANSIATLESSSLTSENQLLFNSVAEKRLVGIYFVAELESGQYITVSPSLVTPAHAVPDTNNWFLSYRIKNTNPVTGSPFHSGDSIEAGINYTTSSYPILPAGSTFSASTLRSVRVPVRVTADSILRVECQSIDVGLYEPGLTLSYDYSLNVADDTALIPDPENLYANVALQVNLGSSVVFYNYVLVPALTSGASTYPLSGNITYPTTSAAPSVSLSCSVYYWDSLIASSTIAPSSPDSIFVNKIKTSTSHLPFADVVRFYYTLTCAASGTPKIVEPTFNGAISGTIGSTTYSANANIHNGYWATRGFYVGERSGTIRGNACDSPYYIPPVTLTKFNYGNITNSNICSCYFH